MRGGRSERVEARRPSHHTRKRQLMQLNASCRAWLRAHLEDEVDVAIVFRLVHVEERYDVLVLLHLPQVEDLPVRPLGVRRVLEGVKYLLERHGTWLLVELVALRLVDAGRLPHDAIRTWCAHNASKQVHVEVTWYTARRPEFDRSLSPLPSLLPTSYFRATCLSTTLMSSVCAVP